MNDDQKAVENEVEADTTQTDSPPVEEQTTDVQTEVKESDDQGSVAEESDDIPESNEEQRRAFQEMRQEIKQLKAEKESRSKGESAFSQFKQQTPPESQTEVDIRDYQDPITGETNWQAYNQQVNEAIARAQQSATYAAQQAVKDEIDEQTARTKYPDIMSDKEKEQEVADLWVAAKLRGENLSVTEIAERLSKRESKTVSKAEKIGAEKILNEVSEKEKASLSVSSQTSQPAKQAASAEQLEELSKRSRFGDDDAIAARMAQIPWANK